MAAIRAGGRRSYRLTGPLAVDEFQNPVGAAAWPRFAPGDGAPTEPVLFANGSVRGAATSQRNPCR
jgi:hypothetical protein